LLDDALAAGSSDDRLISAAVDTFSPILGVGV
jgi:hypothetical protein